MMWILLIASLLVMSALTVIQTPREWFKKPILRVALVAYHAIGVSSILLLLWGVHLMPNGFWREAIVWVETVYFTVTSYALVFALIRYLCFSIALRFDKRKVITLLGSRGLFYGIVLTVSFLYLVPSIYNAVHLKSTPYEVDIDKACADESVRAVLLADFHVGAGATSYELDQMTELVAEANPDIVLIAGDVADSSSSVSDLEYLEQALQKMNPRYGIYYAEGNHERESRYDPEPYLERAGVTILKDEGIALENGLNIVGRKNELKKSVSDIVNESGLDPNAPLIVIQHKPKKLETLIGQTDLVVGGHTHGYQFPFLGMREPLTNTVTCGYRKIGNSLQCVVTTGVSQWGYKEKWPSQSEIAVIDLNFAEVSES